MLRALGTWGRRGGALPTREHAWLLPAPQQARWRHFAQALGYPACAEPPLCFHYLALQRAQMQAMLAADFPHPLPGIVHLAQRLERLRPWQVAADGLLRLDWAEDRGPDGALRLRMNASLEQGGQPSLRASSLYLLRRGRRTAPGQPASPAPKPQPEPVPEPALERIATWVLPANAGRRHAWLTGDINPIHLWPWTARLFGRDRPIIHGMHSAARTEAELARALGRPLSCLHIEFLKALTLPGTAHLVRHGTQGFALLDATQTCVARGQYG
ncbi:MaoC/PaaZ C-terminal domain-containing protein [Inhella sp.]|uniref:MaoC/PaaZ C-terminal domain-containing protein n=1 Tax=Inhella sp. TaxID=1921806 RepID=UPI0035B167C6